MKTAGRSLAPTRSPIWCNPRRRSRRHRNEIDKLLLYTGSEKQRIELADAMACIGDQSAFRPRRSLLCDRRRGPEGDRALSRSQPHRDWGHLGPARPRPAFHSAARGGWAHRRRRDFGRERHRRAAAALFWNVKQRFEAMPSLVAGADRRRPGETGKRDRGDGDAPSQSGRKR